MINPPDHVRFLRFLLLVALSFGSHSAWGVLVRGPYVWSGSGNSYYSAEFGQWESIEEVAKSMGGHLVTINNAEENAMLVEQFSHLGAVLIGLRGPSLGHWVGNGSDYSNWAEGEPNWVAYQPFQIEQGIFDAAIMRPDGKWALLTNLDHRSGIIEVPDATVTVTGRVLKLSNSQPLSDCTISFAGRAATTGAKGTFILTDVDLRGTGTLKAAHLGYIDSKQVVMIPDGAVSVDVGDILLQKEAIEPVITSLKPTVKGLYLASFGLSTPVLTSVDWNGTTPGSVSIVANSHVLGDISGLGPYAATLDVDRDLTPSFSEDTNKITAAAVNAELVSAKPLSVPLHFIPFPSFLSSVASPTEHQKLNASEVGFDFEAPVVDASLDLPDVGKVGVKIDLNAAFRYSVPGGGWNIDLSADAAGEIKKWRRPILLPAADSKVLIHLGPVKIRGHANGSISGNATLLKGIVPEKGSVAASAFGEADAKIKVSAIPYPPLQVAMLENPLLRAYLNRTFLDVRTKESFGGSVELDPYPTGMSLDINLVRKGGVSTKLTKDLSMSILLGGEGSMHLAYPIDSQHTSIIRTANLKLSAELGLKLWSLDFGGQIDFAWVVFDYESKRTNAQRFIDTGSSHDREQVPQPMNWSPVERSWRMAGPEQFVGGGGTVGPEDGAKEIVKNALPGCDPAIAGRGNEQMLIYVQDSGATNELQFTQVAFSRFDGIAWSAPAPVAPDPRGQFHPKVAYDGTGRAVAVWEQIKDPGFSTADPVSFAAQMEIISSTWDPVTHVWSEPTALTDNNNLDFGIQMAGPLTNGDLILTWTENQSNSLIGTGAAGAPTNSCVLTRKWNSSAGAWESATTLVTDLTNEMSDSLTARGAQAIYFWSQDGDGNLEDDSDTELYYRIFDAGTGFWGNVQRYTNDTIADTDVKVQVAANGTFYLVWRRGGDMVMDRNFVFFGNFLIFNPIRTVVRTESTGMGFSDFTLTLGPTGQLLLIWQQTGDAAGKGYYLIYDPASATWSADTALSKDIALDHSFAPVWDATGTLVLAYNRVAQTSETSSVTQEDGSVVEIPNVPTAGRVDLLVSRKSLVKDLAFGADPINANGKTFLTGDLVTISSRVRNTGDLAAQNVQVSFYDGDPSAGGALIATRTVSGWLKSGEEKEVTFEWTVPAPVKARTIHAVIDPENQISESSETNNKISLDLNGADLQVEFVSGSVLPDGTVRAVARVQNISAPTSAVTQLRLWPKEHPGLTPLASIEVAALAPQTFAEIPVLLPAGTQVGGEATYRFVVDEEESIPDIDRTNNDVSFTLSLFADEDGDGLPRKWEMENGLSDLDPADADLDSDGDGFTNRQEFVALTDPKNANSYLKVQFSVAKSGNASIANISWPSVSDRTYGVERSIDMVNWQTVGDTLDATPPTNLITDEVTAPDGHVFYRVKVFP
ncbi:MAG: CARDB domain-containing protein [Luteolibacter sp.]|uniref:CARDB domain-containing protein n=1 Tax=Luteolibacter sp. TaxID=1962973 RepID=UPI003266295C